MDAILIPGIALILFLQSLADWLVGPMSFFSFLGSEEFYLIVAPAILWCLDARLGLRLGIALMFSAASNSILKLAFHAPRPYWVDANVAAYSTETSFGLPSGHAQNAVVVWGLLGAWGYEKTRKAWTWILALLVIFLISISRLHLGVHFPTDTLAGWLVGALILWAFLRYETRFLGWYGRFTPLTQGAWALGGSLLLILVGALVRAALGDWSLPAAWQPLIAKAHGGELVDPLALSGLVSNSAVLFGLACGGILLKQRGWFDAGGPLWQRLARYLIGLAGVLALRYGLGAIFPGGEDWLALAFRYVRYGLIGFWVAGLAPLLFLRIRLAKSSGA